MILGLGLYIAYTHPLSIDNLSEYILRSAQIGLRYM